MTTSLDIHTKSPGQPHSSPSSPVGNRFCYPPAPLEPQSSPSSPVGNRFCYPLATLLAVLWASSARPSGGPLAIWLPVGCDLAVLPLGPLAAPLRPTPTAVLWPRFGPFPPRPTGRPSGRSLATRSLWPPSGSSALLPTRWGRLGRMLPHTLVVLSTSFDRLVGATSVWAASISDTLRFSLIFVPFSGFQSLRFSFEVLSTGSRLYGKIKKMYES